MVFLWNTLKHHLSVEGLIEAYRFYPDLREEIEKLLKEKGISVLLSRDKSTFCFHKEDAKLPFKKVEVPSSPWHDLA
jgi:hypothetical protein